MTRQRHSKHYPAKNFLVFLIACGALAVVHVNSDPEAIGGSPMDVSISMMPPLLQLPPSPALPDRASNAVNEDAKDEQQVVSHVDDPTVLHGIWALKMTETLLRKGAKSFETIPDYTASFYKQERLRGVLSDGSTIDFKMKHKPFSVYMKWRSGSEKGQQAIFVKEQNKGKVLVQPGGIRGRLTGVLSLDPNGSLAMANSLHPITQVGILELARTILKYQEKDLERGSGFQCQLVDNQTFDDRPCFVFTCLYDSPEINSDYRKSILYIDKDLSIPVCVKNFCWAKDANPETIDEETLLEFYAYSDLKLLRKLDVAEFEATNRAYRMRVRR